MDKEVAAWVWPGLLNGQMDFDALPWRPFYSGVGIVELYPVAEDGAHAALLRYRPGASVPLHVHSGLEHILVLQGAQRDERGEYGAGTLVVNRPGTSHRVCSDDGCIVLAIWQKPVRVLTDNQ